MESDSTFEIPLESLAQGVHSFKYTLDDAFFEAFGSELVSGGDFQVALEIERIRNQFNLALKVQGSARVVCDRCLQPFDLPLETEDEILVKFDSGGAREEEDVIYVPFGTESFNVAKYIYDVIGLSLPIAKVHDAAGLTCDPAMLKYLEPAPDQDGKEDQSVDQIPEDSPWAALRDLGPSEN